MRSAYAVSVLAALIGCSTLGDPEITEPEGASPSARSVFQLGEPFTLAPGEGAENATIDLVVHFVEVAGDSRCPGDVTCVWAGDAEVLVRMLQNGEEGTYRLHTHGQPIGPSTIDLSSGHRLELVGLQPGTRANRIIPQDEYRATFRLVTPLREN